MTLAELKNAARDPSQRRGVAAPIPTPIPTATSAIRRFHREGPEPALDALNSTFDRSAYWGPAGSAQARGWADAIRNSFRTYIELASGDNRPTLGAPVTAEVPVGANTVGVSLDVVLLDPDGYVGRYILWDTPALTQRDAELLAAPVVRALHQELGEDRTVGAEIWHLRTASQFFVDTPTALARSDDVRRIIEDYAS